MQERGGAICAVHGEIASWLFHVVVPRIQETNLELDDALADQLIALGVMTQVSLPIESIVRKIPGPAKDPTFCIGLLHWTRESGNPSSTCWRLCG